MNKKYLFFVILLVFALLLSACSQKAAEPTAVPTAAEPTEVPAAEEPTEAPAAEEPAEAPEKEASAEIQVPSLEDGYKGPALTTEEITLSIIRPDNGPEEDDLLHARFD